MDRVCAEATLARMVSHRGSCFTGITILVQPAEPVSEHPQCRPAAGERRESSRHGEEGMKIRNIALFCGMATCVAGAGQLELSKKWIKDNMNHATTGKITFRVKEAKKSVNTIASGAADGDLHIAGSSKETGLPMVAEIINGK